MLITIKRDWVKKTTLNYSNCRTWLPHTLRRVCLRREPVVQIGTKNPVMTESAVLSHRPHSGDTAICYITSSLAYLSSGEWSSCYSEAFRIRRKKLNDNFILIPCKSSIPLVLKHFQSTHRLLWTTKAVRASPLFPYLTAAARN